MTAQPGIEWQGRFFRSITLPVFCKICKAYVTYLMPNTTDSKDLRCIVAKAKVFQPEKLTEIQLPQPQALPHDVTIPQWG